MDIQFNEDRQPSGRQTTRIDLIGQSDSDIDVEFPRLGEGEAGWGWRAPDLED